MKSNWGRLKKQDLGTGRGKGGSEGLEMEIGPNKERLLRMLLFGDDWKKNPHSHCKKVNVQVKGFDLRSSIVLKTYLSNSHTFWFVFNPKTQIERPWRHTERTTLSPLLNRFGFLLESHLHLSPTWPLPQETDLDGLRQQDLGSLWSNGICPAAGDWRLEKSESSEYLSDYLPTATLHVADLSITSLHQNL